jgi:hypothetical protein
MSEQSAESFGVIVSKSEADSLPEGMPSSGKISVSKERLAANVQFFLAGLQDVFAHPPEQTGDFLVESISVTAEIAAGGALNILGSGGHASSKGGITFVFKRKP